MKEIEEVEGLEEVEEVEDVDDVEEVEEVEGLEEIEDAEDVEEVEEVEDVDDVEEVEDFDKVEGTVGLDKVEKAERTRRLKRWQIVLIAGASVLVVLGCIVIGVYFGVFYGEKGVEVETSEITDFKRVENIIGNTTINDGMLDNKILLSELVPDAETKDIKIEEGSVASIEGEWLMVSSMGSFTLSIRRKDMTFRVVDGYNVNTPDEVARAAVDKKDIVLQSNIDMTNVADLPSANNAIKLSNSIVLYSNLYGNAYTIDASHRVGSSQYSVLFYVRGTDIIISNVHLIGCVPVPAEGESIVYDDYEIGGSLVKFDSAINDNYPLEAEIASGVVEYSVLEKAHKIIWINAADVLLKGNVIREASDACVSIQTTNIRHSDIVMENNVMINPQVAGVLFWKIEPNITTENFARLEIKGQFDVYNWKNEETAALMPGAEGKFLSTIINTFIRNAVSGDSFDDMLIKMYDHKWVHIGIVVISSSAGENLPVITGYEEIGYSRDEFPFPSALEGLVGSILRTRDLYGYTTIDDMDPLEYENINAELFEELWGDSYIA